LAKNNRRIEMKRLLALVMAAAVVVSAEAAEIRKTGPCKLQVAESAFDKGKVFSVTVGNDKVEAACDFRGGDFFAAFAVFAVPRVTNKSGKPINVSYHVAFFDKAGELIASTSQESDLDADAKEHQLSSCLAKIPKDCFERIASYKLVIYTGDAKN
jgi:hypothetical protein